MTGKLIEKLNIPALTRLWMAGNLKWLIHVMVSLASLLLLVNLNLVFDSILLRFLCLLNLLGFLFMLFCTGVTKGIMLNPLCMLPGGGKNIALSFDDGPHPVYTLKILEILDKLGVKAAFFITGRHVERHPDITRLIADKGHDIGNHSYSHRKMNRMGPGKINSEFTRFNDALKTAGLKKTILFRPPHGLKNPLLEYACLKHGIRMIHWNLSPKDWKTVPPALVLSRLVMHTRPGSIVLLHDSPNAVAVLDGYIREMQNQGYNFRRISEFP